MAVVTNVPLDPESLKVPAVWVNRFQITAYGGNFRVSFAEVVKTKADSPETVAVRFAAFLTPAEVRELAQLLTTAADMFAPVTGALSAAPPPAQTILKT
jgi:hypothetical protein